MNYEKVSVNIDDKKLAKIDLLIANGFYANRSEFINDAVQSLLEKEDKTIDKLLSPKSEDSSIINDSVWFIGVYNISKDFLLRVKALGTKINIKGFGVLTFSSDCDETLIKETIASISKKIKLKASNSLSEYYKHL